MKILWIDIDTLRPDHMSCYGYHRKTTPHMDEVAKESLILNQCFVSDSPCLPARSALQHGRFGIHTGVMNHGGLYADPFPDGATRGFNCRWEKMRFFHALKRAGMTPLSCSSFGERHDSWWFHAGFREVFDVGKGGMETADEVTPSAIDMMNRYQEEDFFLHYHIWDPHTPYRTPLNYGNPFESDPVADWMTPELLAEHQQTYGLHSSNIVYGVSDPSWANDFPREPSLINDMDDYKTFIDGYDVGIHYADHHVGKLIQHLKEKGIYEDTAIFITSDHGENMGELNVYGDHQNADLITNRVPMIIKYPGVLPGENNAKYYQFDIAASLLNLIGEEVPEMWDGVSYIEDLTQKKETGRDYLVLSQGAWSCERAVVWGDHILIKTYQDALRDWPDWMLFNAKEDPHELNNLAESRSDLVVEGNRILENWVEEQLEISELDHDPMQAIMREGGAFHLRGETREMLKHYEKIGRHDLIEKIKMKYGDG